jgi:phospholipid N-methyltransferase
MIVDSSSQTGILSIQAGFAPREETPGALLRGRGGAPKDKCWFAPKKESSFVVIALDAAVAPLQRYYETYISKWRSVGAIAPSSRFLARSMAEQVSPADAVLEVGAGGGAVTRVLAERVPEEQLHVVELDADRKAELQTYTPNVYITDIRDLLDAPPLDMSGTKVISGLPLLNFSEDFRRTVWRRLLLEEQVASIRQFTYGPQSLFSDDWLGAHDVRSRRIDFVMMNLPPAFVWEYVHVADAPAQSRGHSDGVQRGRTDGTTARRDSDRRIMR